MPDLLQSFSLKNGRVAPNRVALAAMTNRQSHADGTLSEDELVWLARRAEGGFGIITTCASHVSKDGQGWSGELGCCDDSHVDGLRRIADVCRRHAALSILQIFHGGIRADETVSGAQPWSASEEGDRVRAGTAEDLARVIRQFGDAAERAQRAGMDGVEIHGAHGYLLTQFLSRTQNRRADAWGGPIGNRARLAREVTKTVRARVAGSFIVGIRISPEDAGNAEGLDLDESLLVAAWLAEDGADFIHVSLPDANKQSDKRPEHKTLALFRAAVPADVALLTAGKIWTKADGEAALAHGASAIALGRSAIANPDWPKLVAGRDEVPRMPPLSAEELRARALSPGFVEYMRSWRGFVSPAQS